MKAPELGDVSRETEARLKLLVTMLHQWNPRINLVSRGDLPQLESRHLKDSAQLLRFAPADARHWADLGSGGGFPGLVVAAMAAQFRPALRLTLVEADQRKAAFLASYARRAGLSARVVAERIENTQPLGADVVSARALAPLVRLIGLAAPHLALGGICLFPKGASWSQEVDAARSLWQFQVTEIPSVTDPAAAILQIEGIVRV